ncbi:MAG: hypothetical protein HN929_04980 [Chloroflexi bacterium]|jgi:transcription initiation factor TFIIIB Brf1 subunit/transcription initiation factor TFIIB|nr:hypothetical protein [Chloroflexota bacterium]MBT7080806.1 hypothetical protein [Chloroflexota bacterium]MBT7289954.1 hypothetical protein [Chloroflexota bacterium]
MDNPFQYENCPECGQPMFLHDETKSNYACQNKECGLILTEDEYKSKNTVEEKDSLLTKVLKALKLKR